MNVAVGDEAPRVTRLDRPEPERGMRWLRRQNVRHVRALDVLVVQGRCVQHRVFAWRVRSVDVDGEPRAVAHGNTDASLLDHRFAPAFRDACDRRLATVEEANRARPPRGTISFYFTFVKYNFELIIGRGVLLVGQWRQEDLFDRRRRPAREACEPSTADRPSNSLNRWGSLESFERSDNGSHEENASKQESRASVLIQSEPN